MNIPPRGGNVKIVVRWSDGLLADVFTGDLSGEFFERGFVSTARRWFRFERPVGLRSLPEKNRLV